MTEVTPAVVGDRARVVETVVEAFRADPAFRYFFPVDASYADQAAAFAGYLFDRRIRHASVWVVAGGASVSMWDRPASSPAGPDVPAVPQLPPDASERLRRYEEAVHPLRPDEPHWYLGVLATHPDSAGRRWGRAVMAVGLEHVAAAQLPAYLETTNPANVDLYRRAGWSVDGSARVGDLEIWVMRHPGVHAAPAR